MVGDYYPNEPIFQAFSGYQGDVAVLFNSLCRGAKPGVSEIIFLMDEECSIWPRESCLGKTLYTIVLYT